MFVKVQPHTQETQGWMLTTEPPPPNCTVLTVLPRVNKELISQQFKLLSQAVFDVFFLLVFVCNVFLSLPFSLCCWVGGEVMWCREATGARRRSERKPRFTPGWLTLLLCSHTWTHKHLHMCTHTHTCIFTDAHAIRGAYTHTHIQSSLRVVHLNTSCGTAHLWKGKLNFTGTKLTPLRSLEKKPHFVSLKLF